MQARQRFSAVQERRSREVEGPRSSSPAPSASVRRSPAGDRPRVDPGAALRRARLLGHRVTSANLVQPNRLLSNTYERSESPVTTIKNFVSEQTGQSEAAVLASMKKALAGKDKDRIGTYVGELDGGAADLRPISSKAYIDTATGSGGRSKLITAIGKLGNFEDYLRRGDSDQDYDGGHLVALEFFNNWDGINSARNLAPEERQENQRRSWRAMEYVEKRMFPLLVNTYVNYPTDQYTVSLQTVSDQMLHGAVKAAVDVQWFKSLKRVTVDTRLPSQFVTEYTKVNPREWGGMETGPADKSAGYSPTTILPTRIPRLALAPVEDLILRVVSAESRGGMGMTGGALVVANRSTYDLAAFRAVAENMARMGVYYFMWAHGMALPLAVHASVSYFGSGAGESLLQALVRSMAGGRDLPTLSWLTSLANSLLRYTGGDRLLSLGLSTATALTRAVLAPRTALATLAHRLGW